VDTPQRAGWTGRAVNLGEQWRLRRQGCEGAREAVCRLFSHPLGWELRVEINAQLVRTEVCQSEARVAGTSGGWKAAMIDRGWA
jgi:hypothetical protein